MKLFHKIVIPISLILTITMLIISYVIIQLRITSIENQYVEILSREIDITKNTLDNLIDDVSSMIAYASSDPEIIRLMEQYDANGSFTSEEEEEIWLWLRRNKSASSLFNNAFVSGVEGIIRYDAMKAFYDNNYDLNADVKRSSYFHMIKENLFVDQVVTEPRIAPANSKPVFLISSRIPSDDFIGVLAYPINLSAFIEQVVYKNRNKEETNILMVHTDGQIFASMEEDHIYNESYNIKKQNEGLFQTILDNESGYLKGQLFGKEVIMSYGYYKVMNVYFISYRRTDELDELFFNSIAFSAGLMLLVNVVLLLTMLLIINRMIKPIRLLAQYTDNVGRGKFDFKIDTSKLTTKDEISQLTKNFEEMRNNLHTSFSELQKKNNEISYFAEHDALTGLGNRRIFENLLTLILKGSSMGSVVLMDIDNFKMINDTLGHIFGDQVLIRVSSILKEICDDQAQVYRFGGDEFIILIDEDQEGSLTNELVETIRSQFDRPIQINMNPIEIKFSIGISRFPKDSRKMIELIRYADLALYEIKESTKNDYCYFAKEMEMKISKKVQIQYELKNAIENDGFKLVYQPQISLETGKVTGYEALIRMKNHHFGPAEFIPVAEEMGYIISIGRWVVDQAMKQMNLWRSKGIEITPIAVNYSAFQLHDAEFVDYLSECLTRYDIKPDFLELEVTESILLDRYWMAREFFEALSNIGIKFSIDDFGTGYSSINYMMTLPVYKIKLDKSLIDKFLFSEKNAAIGSMVQLIHALGLKVVAEGVEVKEQMENLKLVECDYAQGYYFSKPIEATEVPDNIKINYLQRD